MYKILLDLDKYLLSYSDKRLALRMTAQPCNRFVFCVVVVAFAV